MTKREKRLQKIRQNPRNVPFDDLKSVLEDYGFVMRTGKGTSHRFFFRKIGDRAWPLTIPFKKPHIKFVYVKQALEAIDEIIELTGEDEEENENDD